MSQMTAPEQTFREIRAITADGISMRSKKWGDLDNPKTELEQAQL